MSVRIIVALAPVEPAAVRQHPEQQISWYDYPVRLGLFWCLPRLTHLLTQVKLKWIVQTHFKKKSQATDPPIPSFKLTSLVKLHKSPSFLWMFSLLVMNFKVVSWTPKDILTSSKFKLKIHSWIIIKCY